MNCVYTLFLYYIFFFFLSLYPFLHSCHKLITYKNMISFIMLSQKDAYGNIAPFSNKLKKDNPIKSKSVAKSSKLKTHSSTHKKIQKIHSKKKAETSVFTVAYNVKSRNNWVVPGDESLKVLPNKWHNDKQDKICNVCGGNNHDASKCQICLRNHTWDQKAIQSFSLPGVHHIPESLSQHKRPRRENRLNRARKETQISLCRYFFIETRLL